MIHKFSLVFILGMMTSIPNSFGAEATTPVKELKDEKINVFEMKHKLEEQSRHIQELTKEMNQVEVNLGLQNKRYLKQSDARIKLEESLNVSKKNIDLDNSNLKKNYNETKSVLMGILLNRLEKTESPSDMLARKILVQNLQSRMVDLEALMKSNKEVQGSVEELYKRLETSVQTEKELVGLMNDLEQRKRDLKQTILNENAKRDEYSAKLDELKNRVAIERDSERRSKKKVQMAPTQITEEIKIPSQGEVVQPTMAGVGYHSPLYLHQGIEYNQKGVTFKFQGKNEVLATKAGKIVYTGSLANYGNVIMIDHGNDTRSVLLGQFDISIKNGDAVRESQIIGYTNPRTANGIGDGKIYFEVRKNNLAQNTYLLLDKKTLAKNTSK